MITSESADVENRVREITVRVPARLHEQLARAARAENEHAATIVRRALRRELLNIPSTIETR